MGKPLGLIKIHEYTGYQLYATVRYINETSDVCLRYVVAVVLSWLRKRIGPENIPMNIIFPSPEEAITNSSLELHQFHESCGYTIIFEEKGLKPDVDFELGNISSDSNGLTGNTYISNIINKYKNYFGKAQVVVIQSQLGVPICAYSGKDVYWEVSQELPKTTKLMVDKKALYLHRANFQIIDNKLIK